MTYIIQWSDNLLKTPLTLADNVSDNTSTDLTLTGRGFVNWGLQLQQNLVHLLENFASYGVPPAAPTAGQLWYNADPNANRLNISNPNTLSGWTEIANRRIDSAAAPTYIAYSGDTWYDTTYNTLNVFNSATLPYGSWRGLAFSSQVMGNYAIDTGTVNHIVVALDPPVVTYTHNFTGAVKISNNNTSLCTIDMGAGEVPLLNDVGGEIVSNDLLIGSIISYIFIYSENKAYVTSILASQIDTNYAKRAGSNNQIFRVASAIGPDDAVPYLQMSNLLGLKAPLVSPGLSGIPTAPTAPVATSNTQIATTEFTHLAVADYVTNNVATSASAYYNEFSADFTWTCPPGVTQVRISGCGGGAGGSSSMAVGGGVSNGFGGAPGQTVIQLSVTVIPGNIYQIIIGAGGIGGIYYSPIGTAGGNTIFRDSTPIDILTLLGGSATLVQIIPFSSNGENAPPLYGGSDGRSPFDNGYGVGKVSFGNNNATSALPSSGSGGGSAIYPNVITKAGNGGSGWLLVEY